MRSPSTSGRRLLDAAALLALLAFLLTAFGARLVLDAERPLGLRGAVSDPAAAFGVFVLLAGWSGVLPGGWLRTLAGADAIARPVEDPLRRRARLLKFAFGVAALAFALSPLALDPKAPWPDGLARSGGFLLVSVVVAAYAAFARRGVAFAPPGSAWRLSALDAALLLALPFYAASIGNGVFLSSGDNLATRYAGPLLVREGTLDLRRLPEFRGPRRPYSTVRIGERLLPGFPLGTALLALPHTAVAGRAAAGEPSEALVERWEKHAAALLTSATVVLLFLAFRRLFAEGPAFLGAALVAFGTTAFTSAGQALWSTTGELFCVALALFAALGKDPAPRRSAAAGLAMGAAFGCRPTALVLAAGIGLALWLLDRRSALAFAVATAAAVGAVAAGLHALYGHPLGGYGLMNLRGRAWGGAPLEGLAGNLVSPSRGLLLFCPFLLAFPLAARATKGDGAARAWLLGAAVSTAGVVALAGSYAKWWGGSSIGPRLLTEAAPFLPLLVLPALSDPSFRGARRTAFFLAAVFAGATQLLAAYRPALLVWNDAVEPERDRSPLWSPAKSQLAAIWLGRAPLASTGPAEIEGREEEWLRLDLSTAANARYDGDPFWPDPSHPAAAHYARLDFTAHEARTSRFRFLPTGLPNAMTTCRGGKPAPLAVPAFPTRRLHAILAAGVTGGASGTASVGAWEVRYGDGQTERLEILLNRDVWEYAPGGRSAPVDPARIYRGAPGDADVLVASVFAPSRPEEPVVSIRLVPAEPPAVAGVTALAVTLER